MEHDLGPDDPRIRARAYELWERAGRPDNRHLEHWAQAVREIAEEDAVNGPGAGLQVPDNASTRVLREAAEHIGRVARGEAARSRVTQRTD